MYSEFTTVIFRNLPPHCRRRAFTSLLGAHGFDGTYDFVHVPLNFESECCVGYALVNFVDHVWGLRALRCFQALELSSLCTLAAAWSTPLQGLHAHIERYRNSCMMHYCIDEQYKPAVYCQGVQVRFPSPTIRINAPRVRRAEQRARRRA
jgi:hypothetical protein